MWPGAPLADAVAMTEEKVIDLIQAFYPQNHQLDSKEAHKFKGSKHWLDAFPPDSGFSFRYYTVTHEVLLDKIGWPDGLTDELLESFIPFLIGLSLDIVPLPVPVAASSSAGNVEEIEEETRGEKMRSPVQRSVLSLLHLSPLPNEENTVVVVPQEHATIVGVPRVDVTLLVSLVPVISTAVLVRLRQSEVRMTMMKLRRQTTD